MKLSIHIIQDDQGGFRAICTSLPGCVSWGVTRDEAKERLHEAISGYVAAMGDFIPENLTQELVEI